jgi:hypothetical protein
MIRLILVMVAVVLTGCAVSGRTSGVLQLSEGHYMVTTESEFGLPAAQKQAHAEASAQCGQLGKKINVIKSEVGKGSGMYTETSIYSLSFVCI